MGARSGNCVRRASLFQRSAPGRPVPIGVFRTAGKEVGKPILFSGVIVVIVLIIVRCCLLLLW